MPSSPAPFSVENKILLFQISGSGGKLELETILRTTHSAVKSAKSAILRVSHYLLKAQLKKKS